MRSRRSRNAMLAAAVALCAAHLLCASGALAQTIVNGNFEGGNTGGVATGWTSYLESGATGAWVVHTAAPVPEGLQWQQVQITTANKYGGVRQTVTNCTPCTTYAVTGYMRTNSTTASSSVFVDPSGGTSRAAATPLCAGTTSTAWVTFSGLVTPKSTTFTVFLDVAVTTVNKAGAFDAITVSPCTAPGVPTNVSANPTTVCGGVSSTLSATVTSGCTVDWYAGSCCGTLVGSGATLVVSPASTTTYYPQARNTTTGCGSSGCGNSVTVVATASPSAPTGVAANPDTVSPGGSSTLTASVTSGCTVDWYTGSCGGTLVGSGTALVVTPVTTTTYYPRARDLTGGCSSASCGAAVTVTVSIPPSSVRRVKYHESGLHDGLTWETALNTVQDAIDVSVAGNEIWVAAGDYTENIFLPSGIALYGGFAGTETTRTQRNWTNNVSTIDGNWAGSVVEVEKNADSNTRIDGFMLRNGRAVTGGGVYCNQGSAPVITNNIIRGNSADYDGGGVFCNLGSAATITCNKITNNGAVTAGGGVRSTTGAAIIANNFVLGNSARYGGGVSCGHTSTASHEYVVNNTIVGNAATLGGGLYVFAVSSASVSNNIVAFNARGIHKEAGSGVPSLKTNCLYGNDGGNYSGIGQGTTDILSDPLLASVTYGNIHIQPTSPCRNTGNNTEVVLGYNDVDNQARIQNTTVDIGADESDGTTWTYTPAIVRVSTLGSDSNSGSSWALAKRNIQSAIDAAAASGGGEVWVKAGTYNEQIALSDFVYVYGGFAGTETSLSQRDYSINLSTVDGQSVRGCVTATLLGYRVSAIDGLKIQNGRSYRGAGILIDLASPVVMNNTLTGNLSLGSGGGISLADSCALVRANQIVGNTALAYGGGVFSEITAAEISRNNIEDNTSAINGAGVFSSTADNCRLINNRIVGNQGDTSKGPVWGSAVAGDSYGDAVLNCNTIADNVSATGSVYSGVYGYMEMYNNIVSFNSSGIIKGTNATVSQIASYTGDPLFVNRSAGDYQLSSGSACINAADEASAPADDYFGYSRSDPDIGCYEYGAGPVGYPVAPTSASANPSTICSGSATTLIASGGSGTTLRWMTGSCGGTSVGTGNGLVVYPTVTTTYYARWETSLGNSSCVSTTVTVSGTAPTATVGGPQTIEAGGTTTALGGNTPTPPATGTWSIVSGGTGSFSSTTDPNATFTHVSGDGPLILRWTVTLLPCTPATADVVVTVGEQCVANGTFDEGFNGDIGIGWTKQTPESGIWAQETTIKHSGVASQKVTDPSGGASYTTWLYQTVPLQPGRVYVPTMWIYRLNSAVARIGVDADGGTSFAAGDAIPTSNQWVYRVHSPFTVGGGGLVTIGLAAGYQTNSGTIYYDDVAFEPQAPQSVGGTATIYAGQSAALTAGGGFGGLSSELCWYTGPAGTGIKVGTGTTLVVFPASTTTYYPRWETTGGCGTSADGTAVTVTVLSAPVPVISGITPFSGPNTGTASITNLAGTGFLTGATVKLTKTGQGDITATGVSVVSAAQITCSFDLMGRNVGLWDVVVTNPDAQYGTLAGAFAVTIADSAPVVGTTIGRLLDSVATSAVANRQFRVWGEVELVDSWTFWLDDGSGTRIKVFAPGYTGLVTGDFASAMGTVDLSQSPPMLLSKPAHVREF